jgi:hypothetical protein
MLVRFFRIVVLFLGCIVATPFRPALAQERSIHVKENTKQDEALVKVGPERTKPARRAAPRPKATSNAKGKKGSPGSSTPVEAPRGLSPRAERSAAARQAFERQTGYANGRPGYLVEHIVPLSCGGTDTPSNMEWLTLAEARQKNKLDRARCR